MSEEVFYVDSTSMNEVREKLDMIAKYKYPTAVRGALNDMAFHMKGRKARTGTLITRATSEFDHIRSKTFIKTTTKASLARGGNVNKMVSGAGVFEKSGIEDASKGLAQQDEGGVTRRKYIPLDTARIKDDESRQVRGASKHNKLDGIIDLTTVPKGRLIKRLIEASEAQRPVIIRGKKKGSRLWAMPGKRIKTYKNGNKRVPLRILHSQVRGGRVKLNRRPFVQLAGGDAVKQFHKYFDKQIKRQLK